MPFGNLCCPRCASPYRPAAAVCARCGEALESIGLGELDHGTLPSLDPHGPRPPQDVLFVLEFQGSSPVRFRGKPTRIIESDRGELFIGRRDVPNAWHPEIDLTDLPDFGFTARRHARLHIENGRLFVTDLKGEKTTAINDVNAPIPTNQPVELRPGDRLIIGDVAIFLVTRVGD